jgi:acyl-CoA reductase-like NAD-dependent aldehyde dehydrogenase
VTKTETLPNQLFLAGEWRDGGAGTFADLNPATEQTLVEVAAASAQDVHTAVTAARAQLSPSGRLRVAGDHLERFDPSREPAGAETSPAPQ